MRFSTICIFLALSTSGAQGFTAERPKSFLRTENTGRRFIATDARADHGPEDDVNVFESLVHPGRCHCCSAHSVHGISPRAARVEFPLSLFAVTAFAGPVVAEEGEETAAPTSELAPSAEGPKADAETAEEPSPAPLATEKLNPAPVPAEPPKLQKFKEAVEKYFPEALPTSDVAKKVQAALSQRKFTRVNTLFGTSVCPDEINNKPTTSLPGALQNAMTDFSGVFHLGGLAGLPYMGLNGMKAFLSHCPTNGKVFIVYGPHVGVTDEGVVGRVERLGKASPSLACDTTLNALTEAVARRRGKIAREELTPAERKQSKLSAADRRQEYIVASLRKSLDLPEAAKLSREDAPAFATYQMFDLVKEQIMRQLQACLKNDAVGSNVATDGNIDEIVLLGGITINRGQLSGSIEPREDYFEPLVFDSYSNLGNFGDLTEAKDLFKPVFGTKPTPFFAM